MDFRFKRQTKISADELGLNAVTLAAERTSNKIDLNGASELEVFVQLTRGGSTTRVDVALDVSYDDPTEASPVWYPYQSQATTAGAVALSDTIFQKTTSVDAKWDFRVADLNAKMARLRVVSGAGAASASDVVTIRAIRAQ